MELGNLHQFLDPAVLTLPVGDRTISVSEVTGDVYLRLIKIGNSDEVTTDAELFPLVLGQKLYDELLPTLAASELSVVGITAYYWQLRLFERAEAFWTSGGKPQAAQATTTPTLPQTLTDEATTTPQVDSGNTTNTRKKSSAAAKV